MPRFPPPVKSFGGFGPRLITAKPLRGLSPLFGVSACSGKTAPSLSEKMWTGLCGEEEAVGFVSSFLNLFLPHSTKLSTRVSFTECLFGWRFEPFELEITCGIFWKCQKTYDRGFILWLLRKKVEKLSWKQTNKQGNSILSPQCRRTELWRLKKWTFILCSSEKRSTAPQCVTARFAFGFLQVKTVHVLDSGGLEWYLGPVLHECSSYEALQQIMPL